MLLTIKQYIYVKPVIDQGGRVFASGLRDQGSVPGHIIPKT